MSLENFFQNYPAQPELESQVNDERLRLHRTIEPPVLYLADGLIKAATDGIRTVNNIHDFDATPEEARNFFQMTQNESASIIVMNSLKGLMEAVNDGYFEHDTLRARINLSFSGTPLRKFDKPDWMIDDCETITNEKHAQMQRLAVQDPTFSVFFKNPENLPQDLKKFLDSHKILQFPFTQTLLTEWEKRAKFLTAESQQKKELKPRGEFFINKTIDSQLENLLANLDL